jgi:hypothetical protein
MTVPTPFKVLLTASHALLAPLVSTGARPSVVEQPGLIPRLRYAILVLRDPGVKVESKLHALAPLGRPATLQHAAFVVPDTAAPLGSALYVQ